MIFFCFLVFGSSESEIEVNPDIYLSDDNPEPTPPALSTKARIKKQITEEFMDDEGYLRKLAFFLFYF